MNGFDNPKRDPKTAEFKNQIGQGCKIKMDEAGNVLVSCTILVINKIVLWVWVVPQSLDNFSAGLLASFLS